MTNKLTYKAKRKLLRKADATKELSLYNVSRFSSKSVATIMDNKLEGAHHKKIYRIVDEKTYKPFSLR